MKKTRDGGGGPEDPESAAADRATPLENGDAEMGDAPRADPVGDELRRQAIQNEWAEKKKKLKEQGIDVPATGYEDVEMTEVPPPPEVPDVEMKEVEDEENADNSLEGAEDAAMTLLVQQRLDELQGGKKTYKVPRRSKADIDRKIVHELRDVYKEEVKDRAARRGLRGKTTESVERDKEEGEGLAKQEVKREPEPEPELEPPRAKRTLQEYEDAVKKVKKEYLEETPPQPGRRRRERSPPAPRLPAVKRPLDDDDDDDEGGGVRTRLKTEHPPSGRRPAPRIPAVKRPLDDDDDDDEGGRVRTRLKTEHLLPISGVKRRAGEGLTGWVGARRARRGEYVPPPAQTRGVKRPRPYDDVDPLAREPQRKRADRTVFDGLRAWAEATAKRAKQAAKRRADDREIDEVLRQEMVQTRAATAKRRAEEREIDQVLQEEIRRRPTASRARKRWIVTDEELRRAGNIAGVKRRTRPGEEEIDRILEEELSGIPYKSGGMRGRRGRNEEEGEEEGEEEEGEVGREDDDE